MNRQQPRALFTFCFALHNRKKAMKPETLPSDERTTARNFVIFLQFSLTLSTCLITKFLCLISLLHQRGSTISLTTKASVHQPDPHQHHSCHAFQRIQRLPNRKKKKKSHDKFTRNMLGIHIFGDPIAAVDLDGTGPGQT